MKWNENKKSSLYFGVFIDISIILDVLNDSNIVSFKKILFNEFKKFFKILNWPKNPLYWPKSRLNWPKKFLYWPKNFYIDQRIC